MKSIRQFFKQLSVTRKVTLGIFLFLLMGYIFCLPRQLFCVPYSTVVVDRNGELLGARIASDGQWRFPERNTIPEKMKQCLVTFEDKYFYHHWGVNPLSIGRAIYQNIKYKRIVSGGSTITMQTIRLARSKPRTFGEKLIEIIWATRLECRASKEEILSMYISHAPFGGNVVGLDAAAWRYFGHAAEDLSWAESAMLAVLPNAPSIIHLSKGRSLLLAKRNRLLKQLFDNHIIDISTYELAIAEPLPDEPRPLPQTAPHLVNRFYKEHNGQYSRSTIDLGLQNRVEDVAERWSNEFGRSDIRNLAILVIDIPSNQVIAYCGNVHFEQERNGNQVDIIQAPRSTGSILKPFLYYAMLKEGSLLPHMLLPDIPVNINGFTPQNFNMQYEGAVPASEALARSLNIPAVNMLQRYGVPKFHYLLRQMGFKSINRPASHYGLSLILGGAEATLWEVTNAYKRLASNLSPLICQREAEAQILLDVSSPSFDIPFKENQKVQQRKVIPSISLRPLFQKDESAQLRNDTVSNRSVTSFQRNKNLQQTKEVSSFLSLGDGWEDAAESAAASWLTLSALTEVNRPEEIDWKSITSMQTVAWKTGTSYGFRDAWAVGVTSRYAVGVWVGNATGEGKPGLVGAQTAGPVLFDIFNLLPSSSWFKWPDEGFVEAEVCRQSGYLKGRFCEDVDTLFILPAGLRAEPCPYHHLVTLSADEKYRVYENALNREQTVRKSWFTLPPVWEWYYKQYHPEYKPLPPFKAGNGEDAFQPMQFIYPPINARIKLTKQLDGSQGFLTVELAHSHPDATVFWHLDNTYQMQTQDFHKISLQPSSGKHTLTAVDGQGNTVSTTFFIE